LNGGDSQLDTVIKGSEVISDHYRGMISNLEKLAVEQVTKLKEQASRIEAYDSMLRGMNV